MKKLLLCLVFMVTVPLFGCSPNEEQGIKDSREDFMAELKKALTENDIPFTVDDEGYIRYSKENKEAVDGIKRQVDQRQSSEIGSKYEDEFSAAYFRKLLDEKGISYRVVSQEDGEWTYWNPVSKEQQEELEMKVVTHAFERRKESSKESSE